MGELKKIIKSHQAYLEINNKTLAKRMGLGEHTLGRYINNPLQMPLGTLRILVKILNISDAEILTGITE